MPEEYQKQTELQSERARWEKRMLGQIADWLVKEKLIDPEEQIRFLSLVHKGE